MIEVTNFTKTRISKNFLKQAVKYVLAKEKIKQKTELSIILVGEQRMQKLNKRYRGKDGPTDVLSFSVKAGENRFVSPLGDLLQLGEIVLCPAQINKNAEKDKENWEKALTRALIHGILHLLDYNHYTKKEKFAMENKQEQYLLKLTRG